MTGTPLPDVTICTNLTSLRDSIINIPNAHHASLDQRSNNVLAAMRRKDCLPIYFVTDSASDILLLTILYHRMRNSPPNPNQTPSTTLILLCDWRKDTSKKVLNTLMQHHRHSIPETPPNSRIWSLVCPRTNNRMIITLGDAHRSPDVDEEGYWTRVKHASLRVSDLIGRLAKELQVADFKVSHSVAPIMLFAMPGWFWNCVRVVVASNALVTSHPSSSSSCSSGAGDGDGDGGEGNGGGEFKLSEDMWVTTKHWECILAQARNKFPVLYTDFSFSLSNSKTGLYINNFYSWGELWPKILAPDVYSSLLKKGMDSLFTSLLRLAAAGRGVSGRICVDKGKEYLAPHGAGKPWFDAAGKEESYTPGDCSLETALRGIEETKALVDCPVQIPLSGLAVLIPDFLEVEVGVEDVMAARIAWKIDDQGGEGGDGGDGVKVALSGDSPQYIVVAFTHNASERIESAFNVMWMDYIDSVKSRSNSLARVTVDMAEGWRRFCVATRGLLDLLVRDEEGRGGMTDMSDVKRGFAQGNMTVICKRTLGV